MITPRLFFYSHDTYGLGHFRRTLALSHSVARELPEARICIATGSSRARSFELPNNTEIVDLPGILKQPDGSYRARAQEASLSSVVLERSRRLLDAWTSFRPDVTVIDHAPVGACGELRPLLDHALKSSARGRFVLGLRDIIDDAKKVRTEWNAAGAWPYVNALYDRVLVYGDGSVLTTAEELGLPDSLEGRLRFTGYLAPEATQRATRGPVENPRIIVTAGGGGDGMDALSSWVDFACSDDGALIRSLVITGPYLAERRYESLVERAPASMEILRFTNNLPELLATADGAIAMAGYNTTVELLAYGLPALLIPRAAPRKEQLLRAQRLSTRAPFSVIDTTTDLMPRMRTFIDHLRAGSTVHPDDTVNLFGLRNFAGQIAELTPSHASPITAVESCIR